MCTTAANALVLYDERTACCSPRDRFGIAAALPWHDDTLFRSEGAVRRWRSWR